MFARFTRFWGWCPNWAKSFFSGVMSVLVMVILLMCLVSRGCTGGTGNTKSDLDKWTEIRDKLLEEKRSQTTSKEEILLAVKAENAIMEAARKNAYEEMLKRIKEDTGDLERKGKVLNDNKASLAKEIAASVKEEVEGLKESLETIKKLKEELKTKIKEVENLKKQSERLSIELVADLFESQLKVDEAYREYVRTPSAKLKAVLTQRQIELRKKMEEIRNSLKK